MKPTLVMFARCVAVCALSTVLCSAAEARTVEPGSIWIGGNFGPTFTLGNNVGGADFNLGFYAHADYAISSQIGFVGLAGLGIAETVPLRLALGSRYRLTGLGLPVSPYGQAQLSFARLFDIGDTNLNYLGIRLGAGADYFLTAELSAGAELGFDLGRTLGSQAVFYRMLDVQLVARMRL